MSNAKQLIDFITKTNSITGVSFASLRNYTKSNGEVSNQIVNLGISLSSAKAKDLNTINEANVNELYNEFNSNIDFSIFEKAFNELHDSFVAYGNKTLDGKVKVPNNYAKGQNDAYEIINESVKVHKEFNRLYLYGMKVKGEVLIPGEYKSTTKQKKTLCKDFIKKSLDFKTEKFRMYIVEGADVLNLKKTSFNGENLDINL